MSSSALNPDEIGAFQLVPDLLADVPGDIAQWRNADNPNRYAAGHAAIRTLDVIIQRIQGVRANLANEVIGFDRPSAGRIVPGNSGPGV